MSSPAATLPSSVFGLRARGGSVEPRKWTAAAYITMVIAGGGLLLAWRMPHRYDHPWLTLALAAAGVALSLFKLRLPLNRGVATMSMAYAVDFVAMLTLGPDVAMVLACMSTVVQCVARVHHVQPLHRTVFSIASVVIAVQAAGLVWTLTGGQAMSMTLSGLAIPLCAAALCYFLVNSALVACAISISTATSAFRTWHREFLWSANSYFISATMAGLIAIIVLDGTYLLIPLALAPLYVAYRAYQMSTERIEEELRHAEELAGMIATTRQALERATQSENELAAEKEQLAIESARLAVTVRGINEGVITVDRDGIVVLLNDAARRLAFLPSGHQMLRPVVDVFDEIGLPAAMYALALRRVMTDGESVRLRSDAYGGCVGCILELSGTPTRDAEGRIAGAVWILRDLTDVTRVEHERAKSARLESLGVLAGGLAHDFNNILTGIVGNLSLAQETMSGDSLLSARLTNAAAACSRARAVTNQLLTFAKGGAPVKTTAPLEELVTECARFALSGSAVAPHFSIADDLRDADVDTGQIGQVVHNLVLNGMQAMPRGGVMEIALSNADISAGAASGLTPGAYVALTIRDSGEGIPADRIGRIFDPYFTTKEQGSGLGLAISYSIVKAHGGVISVESTPGAGSCFTILLPASARPAQRAKPRPAPGAPARTSGRALLMDDDESVAEVCKEMLEAVGYTTVVTASGADAIETFHGAEQQGNAFDVVILDLTVPGGMGGSEAIGHIRAIRDDVAVFVTSGYADDAVLSKFRDYGFDGVLPKPFTVAELRDAIKSATQPTSAVA